MTKDELEISRQNLHKAIDVVSDLLKDASKRGEFEYRLTVILMIGLLRNAVEKLPYDEQRVELDAQLDQIIDQWAKTT